jgi:hypothetical protein
MQCIDECLLLEPDLSVTAYVLETASTTDTELIAYRFNTIVRGLQDFANNALIVCFADIAVIEKYRFTGQGAMDEHGLSIDTTDASAVMTERLDDSAELAFREAFLSATPSHQSSSQRVFSVAKRSLSISAVV